jgi:hypothetical protein
VGKPGREHCEVKSKQKESDDRSEMWSTRRAPMAGKVKGRMK